MAFASETRFAGELLELRRSPLWHGGSAPAGHGAPVVLVAGFALPPETLRPLARWLGAGGWDASVAPTGWNVGCGERTAQLIEREVAQRADRSGRAVALVGHSRGGQLARVAAVRGTDAVATLVTVATPWTVGAPPQAVARFGVAAVRAARRRGLHGFASVECADGPCCARFRVDVAETPAAPWFALWSSVDGIAGPDSEPPAGPTAVVDLRTTHLGAVLSVPGWKAIGEALADRR